jgi:uncharacterized Zn finger protein
MKCKRCGQFKFNTIVINRFGQKMPVQKCLICGFLWIEDSDIKELSKADSKRLFIDALLRLGKEDEGNKRNN